MICQVNIDAEGGVTAVVDSDEALDEEAQRLQGLQLDDMLSRAAATAIHAWFAVRRENETQDDGTPQ